MSAYGTGIKQSDEFADVYEEFFEAYKDNADPLLLYRNIWAEYVDEFPEETGLDADTPVLFTVRYALAQCLWECGVKDQKLWDEIEYIITSESDLRFWDTSNGGDETLVRKRRKSLAQFWEKINSEPFKVKKPRKTTVKRQPTLHKGDIFAYAAPEGGYRAAVVFDFVWDSFLIAVCEHVFQEIPSEEEIWDSKTKLVFWCPKQVVIPKKDRILIGHMEISQSYNGYAGLSCTEYNIGCTSLADRSYFFDSEEAQASMVRNHISSYIMKDLLDPKILPRFR